MDKNKNKKERSTLTIEEIVCGKKEEVIAYFEGLDFIEDHTKFNKVFQKACLSDMTIRSQIESILKEGKNGSFGAVFYLECTQCDLDSDPKNIEETLTKKFFFIRSENAGKEIILD